MLVSASVLARPYVLTDTTKLPRTAALQMVTTARSGFQVGYSSEQAHGIAGLVGSMVMSTTISTIARVTVGRFPRAATVLSHNVRLSVVRRCMTFVAGKPRPIVDSFRSAHSRADLVHCSSVASKPPGANINTGGPEATTS
jgi:hypothetical protein